MKNITTINIGSRSKKYAYFEGGLELKKAEFEATVENSFGIFLEQNNLDPKELVLAIRIVAPGKFFVDHKEIDDEYIRKIEETAYITPLHSNLVLKELDYIKNNFPDIKIYAISDSAFHQNMPDYAKLYALPEDLRLKYGIERQGYHGLSLASVLGKLKEKFEIIPEEIIVCHLGGGSSVTAIKNGVSVDTSMGWTPLEGLPMTDRIGDIDPGVIAFLSSKLNMGGLDLERFLATECGLEAVSQIKDGNIPDLIKESENGNKKASLALRFYAHKIKRYIGAMSASLGGAQTLIFTGTVGQRSPLIREMATDGLNYLGFGIDRGKNQTITSPVEVESIGDLDSLDKVLIVPIDEMAQMNKICSTLSV